MQPYKQTKLVFLLGTKNSILLLGEAADKQNILNRYWKLEQNICDL